MQYWDGHTRISNGVRTSISTTDKHAAIIIQTVAHLCGKGSKVLEKVRDVTRKTLYEVSINNRDFHNMATGTSGIVKHSGTYVYCPKTSTGFFMLRKDSNVMVTGNTNYLGQAPTLAAKEGLKVSAVKNIIARYFKLCPEIPLWQEFVKNFALTHGYVENIWGARGEVYDFTDPMWMNKIIAWIPQSSLAILVNKALVALEKGERQMITDKWDFDSNSGLIVPRKQIIEAKLQTHDSISGQFIATDFDAIHRIKRYMEVTISYEDTLIIPAAVKLGDTYGGCKKIDKTSPYLQLEKA